jgi:hypothetical protein
LPSFLTATSLPPAYLHAAGRRRPVLPVRLPGAVFAGYRHGGHLVSDHAVGRRTWEEFLAEQITTRRRSGAGGILMRGRT